MKLFLVKRTDLIIENDYDGMVVRANDEEECLKIISDFIDDTLFDDQYFRKDNTEIIELSNEGKTEVILASYINEEYCEE